MLCLVCDRGFNIVEQFSCVLNERCMTSVVCTISPCSKAESFFTLFLSLLCTVFPISGGTFPIGPNLTLYKLMTGVPLVGHSHKIAGNGSTSFFLCSFRNRCLLLAATQPLPHSAHNQRSRVYRQKVGSKDHQGAIHGHNIVCCL